MEKTKPAVRPVYAYFFGNRRCLLVREDGTSVLMEDDGGDWGIACTCGECFGRKTEERIADFAKEHSISVIYATSDGGYGMANIRPYCGEIALVRYPVHYLRWLESQYQG